MLKTALKLCLLAAALYVVFFVPLGERTLYEHLSRIASTEEARELGGEVEGVVERAGSSAREKVLGPVGRLVDRVHD